jgi:hypothetical protein
MLVRQDFSDNSLPPKMFLMQILDLHAKIYCFLWDKKGEGNRLSLVWRDLTKIYSKNTFKTSLRILALEGLLNWQEFDDKVAIELVGWDDIVDA